MSWTTLKAIFIAVVVAAPAVHGSAQANNDAPRDPADPKAAVPPLRYDSAFARYRPHAPIEVGPWRDANDNVGRIGGWRIYGREAIADSKADSARATGTGSMGAAGKPAHGPAHKETR